MEEKPGGTQPRDIVAKSPRGRLPVTALDRRAKDGAALLDPDQEDSRTEERVLRGERDGADRALCAPERDCVAERVDEHGGASPPDEVRKGNAPDAQRNAEPAGDFGGDPLCVRRLGLAERGKQLKEEENIQIGIRPRVPTGTRPEKRRLVKRRRNFPTNPIEKSKEGGPFPGGEQSRPHARTTRGG